MPANAESQNAAYIDSPCLGITTFSGFSNLAGFLQQLPAMQRSMVEEHRIAVIIAGKVDWRFAAVVPRVDVGSACNQGSQVFKIA